MGSIIQIQLRRDTSANWASNNPILAQGEPGLEVDTNCLKFGNGSTNYNDLPYFGGKEEIIYNAGESIISGRVVILEALTVKHFDPTNAAHYGRIIGVSKTSASINDPVTITISGGIQTGDCQISMNFLL